jgi:ABC-type Fe3+ transport system permease subunit
MPTFNQNSSQVQQAAETAVVGAIILFVVGVVLAVAVAVWMYKDAESRGKNGIAAALMPLLSALYGIAAVLFVLCAWIVFRPDRRHQGAAKGSSDLPSKLPGNLVAVPSSEEFLQDLEEQS